MVRSVWHGTRASRLFTTPKKARPSYSGPIHDPNPINPFSSPARSSTSRSLFVPQPPSSHAKPTGLGRGSGPSSLDGLSLAW
jgi:hypothetical protein